MTGERNSNPIKPIQQLAPKQVERLIRTYYANKEASEDPTRFVEEVIAEYKGKAEILGWVLDMLGQGQLRQNIDRDIFRSSLPANRSVSTQIIKTL